MAELRKHNNMVRGEDVSWPPLWKLISAGEKETKSYKLGLVAGRSRKARQEPEWPKRSKTNPVQSGSKNACSKRCCQDDEVQEPKLICSEFAVAVPPPHTDPGCTRHTVAQSSSRCIWFALTASAGLDPAHADKLRCGWMSLFGWGSSGFSLLKTPPLPYSLTTPWHLRVPGIRLKWEKGH